MELFRHQDLIRRLNSGRCFALVGSGPSCEMGYPSWYSLAAGIPEFLERQGIQHERSHYNYFLSKGKYPELFRKAEEDLKDREILTEYLRSELRPKPDHANWTYKTLSRWPIPVYLTTNWDDELKAHNPSFTVIDNSREALSSIREGSTSLIVKLHGDFRDPSKMIVTSEDYRRISISDDWIYWREKLKSMFSMFDVLILGHSLYDPDIRLVLQAAKDAALPERPIYMILADVPPPEVREMFEQYNIRVISYENSDGQHRQLRQLLSLTNRFVVYRGRPSHRAQTSVNPQELEAAASLFLYRRLASKTGALATEALGALGLRALASCAKPVGSWEDLIELSPFSLMPRTRQLEEGLTGVIESLIGAGYVERQLGVYRLTQAGRETIGQIDYERRLKERMAFENYSDNFRSRLPGVAEETVQHAAQQMREVLVSSFRTRGIALANMIFSYREVESNDLPEIFLSITKTARDFDTLEAATAFVESAHEFLLQPTHPQREYLATLSQGYFLYHLLGQDPQCIRARKEILNKTLWLLDSSLIIQFLAKQCHGHELSLKLLSAIEAVGVKFASTRMLADEVWEHLKWARDNVRGEYGSLEFTEAALATPGYERNAFVDGYVNSLGSGGDPVSFVEYLRSCVPKALTREGLQSALDQHGIDTHAVQGSESSEFDRVVAAVRAERVARGTYHHERQVIAEAEIYLTVRAIQDQNSAAGSSGHHDAYFISRSPVLNVLSTGQRVTTWSPEATYRYLSSLPGGDINEDLLQRCMMHEYYYAGVNLINKDAYVTVFGPAVSQARFVFEEERRRYLDHVEQTYTTSEAEFSDAFEKTPDPEKPFFVIHMAQRMLRNAEARVRAAEHRARSTQTQAVAAVMLESDVIAKELDSLRHLIAQMQNSKNPKHLKKRMRQAKKRLQIVRRRAKGH